MQHVRGAPYHPQTQGKIERWHQTLKNRILLENYYVPGDLERQVAAFVEHYNHVRYHESLGSLTPADVYFGRGETILLERERIKRQTIAHRRLQHHVRAASTSDEPEPPFRRPESSLKSSDDGHLIFISSGEDVDVRNKILIIYVTKLMTEPYDSSRQAGANAPASNEAGDGVVVTDEMIGAGLDVFFSHYPDTAAGDASDRQMVSEVFAAMCLRRHRPEECRSIPLYDQT